MLSASLPYISGSDFLVYKTIDQGKICFIIIANSWTVINFFSKQMSPLSSSSGWLALVSEQRSMADYTWKSDLSTELSTDSAQQLNKKYVTCFIGCIYTRLSCLYCLPVFTLYYTMSIKKTITGLGGGQRGNTMPSGVNMFKILLWHVNRGILEGGILNQL